MIQMCKICGERHHRYEPHRFGLKPEVLQDAEERIEEHRRHLAEVFPAAPVDHRSNARSPTHRTPDMDHKPPIEDLSVDPPAQSLDTPDIAPSETPLSEAEEKKWRIDFLKTITPILEAAAPLETLDDDALLFLRNLVMAEYMRRKRAKPKAPSDPAP